MRWFEGGGMSQFGYCNGGECTCKHSDAQVNRGQKLGLRDERDSTLGLRGVPLYRDECLQSRCNDTCVSGGYEIGESVTTGEKFVGTWRETLQFV